MPYFQPFLINGLLHDLAHLDPLVFQTSSERLGRDIQTWCRFTTHTFSRKPAVGETGPLLLDEGRKPRIFCPDRYALSYHLPSAVRRLSEPRLYIQETAAERNWLHKVEIEIEVGGAHTAYLVFFAVKKAGRSTAHDVEMTIESAYAYDPKWVPKVRGRTMIGGLLTATVEGRRLHTQGGRRKR